MFVFVVYGENSKLLMNSKCAIRNLLFFIKEKCQCEREAVIDLCDEHGVLKNLSDQDENLAETSLQEKAIYIPVLVQKNEDDSFKELTPLLKETESKYPDVFKKLKNLCEDKKRRIEVPAPKILTPSPTLHKTSSNTKPPGSRAGGRSKRGTTLQ